jgi:hypothetical protein
VMACQVGGDRGLKIQVHTESGDVFVRALRRVQVQITPAPVPVRVCL